MTPLPRHWARADLFELDICLLGDERAHDGQHEVKGGAGPDQDDMLDVLLEWIAHFTVAGCQPPSR